MKTNCIILITNNEAFGGCCIKLTAENFTDLKIDGLEWTNVGKKRCYQTSDIDKAIRLYCESYVKPFMDSIRVVGVENKTI